ncbi:MAG: acetyl-CoA carboxylase biotin carboxyl carrier protein [Pseudomonadota bacterium]
MDLRKVKKLIELVEEAGIAELEVSSGDESIRIAMPAAQSAAQTTPNLAGAGVPAVVSTSAAAPQPAGNSAGVAATQISAPMAGTFYRAPDPEAAPFVEPGQQIQAGEVVCIIESMKMMHEIRATQAGTVTSIAVANGAAVGTGETLFVLA